MSKLRIIQFSLWTAVAFAIIALSAYLLVASSQRRAPFSAGTPVNIGGAFSLTSHKGNRLSQATLQGKPFAVFFGFTYCPDVCPTTLFELSNLMKKLGPDADRLVPLFITVDPERDTVEALAQYMTSFDPRIIGLTGSPAEIASTLKAYRAYSRKVQTGSDSYTMDHTAIVYLMDQQGRFAGTLDLHEPEEAKLGKLRRLIKGS